MRILLLHPNYHSGGAEIAGNWPPAWVAYLTGYLKAAGYTDVHFVDAMTHHLSDEQVRERIAELQPDVVGCTAITPAIYKAEGPLQIAKQVNPAIVTVLGGIHGTFMYPQELGDKVEVFDFEKYNFVTPIMKPDAMDRAELLDRVMHNYRRFYFNKAFFQYPWTRDKGRRSYLLGCLKAFAKSGFQRTFYDLGRVGYRGPQSKKSVDFGFDASRTYERPSAAALAEADAGWITMHGPKIEHKRRQGELNAALACGGGDEHLEAQPAVAMACGGGREQLSAEAEARV